MSTVKRDIWDMEKRHMGYGKGISGIWKNYIWDQCPTGRVFQYRIGSGRVLEKIPGSGSGSGRVGVLKYTIGYFRVSFLLSGISGYSWVFPGISGYIGYHLFFLR